MKGEIMGIRVQWMHVEVLELGLEGACFQCALQVIEQSQKVRIILKLTGVKCCCCTVFHALGSGVGATWEVRMGGCCQCTLYVEMLADQGGA